MPCLCIATQTWGAHGWRAYCGADSSIAAKLHRDRPTHTDVPRAFRGMTHTRIFPRVTRAVDPFANEATRSSRREIA